jgi:hypothetical protein
MLTGLYFHSIRHLKNVNFVREDTRACRIFTRPKESRRFAQCLTMSQGEGKSMECTCRAQLDHRKASTADGKLHTDVFTSPKRRLVDLLRRIQGHETKVWDFVAHVAGSHNLPVQTGVSCEF